MDDVAGARALALRLRCEAEDLRALSSAVGATGELAWRSPAAEAFRVRVGAASLRLRATATALDDAALAVELHGEAARAHLAELAELTALAGSVGEAVAGTVARSLP
jgi:hypothetical protein